MRLIFICLLKPIRQDLISGLMDYTGISIISNSQRHAIFARQRDLIATWKIAAHFEKVRREIKIVIVGEMKYQS